MIDWEKHQIYIIVGAIVGIVLLGFLFLWYTKRTVKNELKKISKEKRKKEIRETRQGQREHSPRPKMDYVSQQQDMDSYIDPSDDEENGPVEPLPPQQQHALPRLSQGSVGMRDIEQGRN